MILRVIKKNMKFWSSRNVIFVCEIVPRGSEPIYHLRIFTSKKLTVTKLVEIRNADQDILELLEALGDVELLYQLENGLTLIT